MSYKALDGRFLWSFCPCSSWIFCNYQQVVSIVKIVKKQLWGFFIRCSTSQYYFWNGLKRAFRSNYYLKTSSSQFLPQPMHTNVKRSFVPTYNIQTGCIQKIKRRKRSTPGELPLEHQDTHEGNQEDASTIANSTIIPTVDY